MILVLGCINSPPACHTEDVEDTCDTIDPVPPATVQPYILDGIPPAIDCLCAFDCGLKIRSNCDHDVDCNDYKRPNLEPIGLTDPLLVL